MTLPSTYADSNCSLARTLEIIGERWTLMIIRDAFFGLRRFGDFAAQLKIPRAVLSNRLKSLVHEGVLIRDEDATAGVEYRLTDKGVELWPIVHALMNWGDAFYSPTGPKRALRHDRDGGPLDREGRCQDCGSVVPVPQIRIEPGPGFDPAGADDDPLSHAINTPRRLLEPIETPRTRSADGSDLSAA
ncbi:helix-turn-helix transcriptional regulator [Streptomyces sp. NBC_01617]|uniref:winged helix-turn-helix transcriptional regulator n=1 Tax=Streptomyces sp. NBC_01617 TaxID=2975899 RepID=UPI003864DFC2|nr:helix-turn-helix transcriptional regulator [Streptomyces sp. NBC_01617]